MKKVIAFAMSVVYIICGVITVSAQENTANNMARSSTVYESESNDNAGSADRIYSNGVGYGKISSSSDADWWFVEFPGPGYVDFSLTNIPSGCNYEMMILNSVGSTILASLTASGNQNELISGFWVAEGSRFLIKVYSSSGASASSYYQLGIQHEAYHAYAGVYTGSYTGISANIQMPTSYPNVSDSGESVWVSTSADNNGKWVQTGARYFASTGQFDVYAEYYVGGEYMRAWGGTQALGTTKAYKVECNPDNGLWYAYCENNILANSMLSSISLDVQANGEVHKKNIEMGPFVFSNVKVKNSNFVWVNNTQMPTADAQYQATGTPTNFTVSGP